MAGGAGTEFLTGAPSSRTVMGVFAACSSKNCVQTTEDGHRPWVVLQADWWNRSPELGEKFWLHGAIDTGAGSIHVALVCFSHLKENFPDDKYLAWLNLCEEA